MCDRQNISHILDILGPHGCGPDIVDVTEKVAKQGTASHKKFSIYKSNDVSQNLDKNFKVLT